MHGSTHCDMRQYVKKRLLMSNKLDTFFPHACPYTWRTFYAQWRYLKSVILHKSFPGQQQYIWIWYVLAGWYCCLSFLSLSNTGKSSLMVSESSPNMKYIWPDNGSPYTKKNILFGVFLGIAPNASYISTNQLCAL